jgi:hypothetical protein
VTRLATVAAVAVLALTGCAADDDEPAAQATSTAANPPSTTEAGPLPSRATSTTATATSLDTTPTDERGEPVVPTSAADLAERLAHVEARLRTEGAADAALGHQQQVLYRALIRNPAWQQEVFERLGPSDAARARAMVAAGTSSSGSVGSPIDHIPAWRIRPPLPAGELVELYRAAEAETGVPWSVLAAIHFVETRMGRIEGLSSAGAQGPMQFMPATWEAYGQGGDVTSAADAIPAAGRLLAASGAPGDLAGAVFSYNHSDDYVNAVLGYHQVLAEHPWMYEGLHDWQVYVSTTEGVLWLPEGYESAEPVPVSEYVASRE